MTCECHPQSPFHWKDHPQPSIFVKDIAFRATGVIVTETGSYLSKAAEDKRRSKEMKEKEMTAYKQFGVYTRAIIKPSKNKHEI